MIIDGFTSVLIKYWHVFLFYISLIILLYLNRNKFEMQGRFVFLYKTKFGLKLMDSIAEKYNRTVKFLGTIGIYVGYIGFLFITYALLMTFYNVLKKPDTVAISPVLPGVPIAGTNLIFPLITGWIALLIIIIVHEFSHGVVARAYKQKILSSGIAFFGPIMGAFVEPDEKQISKQNKKVQNSIYAAGPFSNILLTLVAALLLFFVVSPISASISSVDGLDIGPIPDLPAEEAGLIENSLLTKINDVDIRENVSLFYEVTSDLSPGDVVKLETSSGTYEFATTSNPANESMAYMGIYIHDIVRSGNTFELNILYIILTWFSSLLFWVGFISINIGLINLYPIYITDGARMLKTLLDDKMEDKKRAETFWIKINNFAVLILLGIIFLQVGNFFLGFFA
ncbi:hypothetical protein C0585_03205 [Candidatus Woesearchaeota archaeon]|nr:MAG: hypothetical protein C0585_03205 [Candidatus Woesearchaeota archaeon]